MRGVCDGGSVGEMSYCIQTLVFAREGIEFVHEIGDVADHVGTNCSDRGVGTAAKHVILCVVLPTEWAGERGWVLICGALHHLSPMKVPIVG
jgi:hypothetical protein